MTTTRYSGILLHPTSLPGPFGSGDLGKSAYHFVDWLKTGRQSLWQILPLVDAGVGNSPYMSPSAFGGNVLLVDLEDLMENDWLKKEELTPPAPFDNWRVDYPTVTHFRLSRLKIAADRFFASCTGTVRKAFVNFCQIQANWLNNYALFRTLDQVYQGKQAGWQNWPEKLARREPQALREAEKTYKQEIRFWQFCQWRFHEQWHKLKRYANENRIAIIGDIPIFVSLNSADVWSFPALFQLDKRGFPTVVSGVPPDQFSETGQRWGNPLYNWEAMAQTGYQWWINRMASTLSLHDLVRVDHFRGFEAYWEIPADEPTAVGGRWKKGPGADFFNAMQKAITPLNLIAEDLGVITPEVTALRQAFSLPGMCILQFAFDQNPNNLYLPHNHTPDSVVYTGTHDNNTTRGWWQSATEQERDQARRYLSVNGEWIHWDLIRTALASVARYAIAPMQDILGLGTESRMNAPGQPNGAWEWRFSWDQVANWYAAHLAEMTRLYGREPDQSSVTRNDMTEDTA